MSNEVIIVSGLPRSGTSMMMRMLEQGGLPVLVDNLRVADEDNPNGYYEFEPVKKTKENASWLENATGKVVKMVYMLLYDLPEGYQYKVVFMRRRLEEVIKSQDVMLERNQKPRHEISDDELLKLFKAQIDRFTNWVADQSRFEMVEVDYNDVLADPAPTVDRLLAFLNQPLDGASMRAVVDPSLYRNRVSS